MGAFSELANRSHQVCANYLGNEGLCLYEKIPMAFDVWTENLNLYFHLNHQLFIVG